MSTVVSFEARIEDVEVITARLVDGRVISVPLAWSWRLSDATPAQRANWTLIGDGYGVHWPDIDEDLSAEGMLHGIPARRPRDRPHESASGRCQRGKTDESRVIPDAIEATCTGRSELTGTHETETRRHVISSAAVLR